MEYALRALSQRAMSAGDLRTRLRSRAADPSDVDAVIEQLKEPGFVNDPRFAESYAAARLENQGFGRMRVLRDLRQHRISADLAKKVVEKTFEGSDENALVRQYLERKYRGKNLAEFLSEQKNLLSAYRRLRTAGFGGGASIRVLKQYAAAADQLEEDIGDEMNEGEE